MIRINLLGEKIDRSGIYAAHGLAVGGATVLAIFFCFLFHSSMTDRLELATNQKAILDGQLAKLREKTKKVEDLEKNKKLLSEKLTTIAKLKANKTGPVHLLDDITKAIPDRSWLTGIKQKPEGLEFQGVALDPQTVSSFMTQLGNSKWIGGVELIYSKQMMRQEVAVQEFSLLVKLRSSLDAGKDKAKDGKNAASTEKGAQKKKSKAEASSSAGSEAL